MSELILAALAALALIACGSTVESGHGGATTTFSMMTTDSSTTTGTGTGSTTTSCGSGTKYAEPGCGDPGPGVTPLPGAGCYPTCTTEGAPCVAAGTSCKKTLTNPCLCPDPNGVCCGACGGEELLCLP